MFRSVICLAALLFALAAAPRSAMAVTCEAFANGVVREAVEDVLDKLKDSDPGLKKLGQQELINLAGAKLVEADKPDIKAYGYMMLLWYGEGEARRKIAETGAKLEGMKDRAHYHFVLALMEISSKSPQIASRGRGNLRELRESGHVAFVDDAMWDRLVEDCEIAE